MKPDIHHKTPLLTIIHQIEYVVKSRYNLHMTLNICWLYYDLMNTYGDYGNLLALEYRLKQLQIKTQISYFSVNSSQSLLEKADLFLMGGAEDRQQELVAKDLVGQKRRILQQKIQKQVPGLYICGAYQFLGEYYLTAAAKKLNCLNFAPLSTKSAKPHQTRLIGDIVVEITNPNLRPYFQQSNNRFLIGFENHNGRTYLKKRDNALGKVILGKGNNGLDHLECVFFQNTLGTYLHGPILPRNPALADVLIEKALQIKYNQVISLKPIDDQLEQQNRLRLLKEFHVKI